MELFQIDGHFTDEGLHAIAAGTLNELQSLEAAEHLSFCDACLDRYTAVIDADLLDPPSPLREPVVAKIKKRKWKTFVGRYATVPVAACLAMVFVGSGLLTGFSSSDPTAISENPAYEQREDNSFSLSAYLGDMLGGAASGIGSMFDGLFSLGGNNQSTNQTANAEQNERDKREDLFGRHSTPDNPQQEPEDNTSSLATNS